MGFESLGYSSESCKMLRSVTMQPKRVGDSEVQTRFREILDSEKSKGDTTMDSIIFKRIMNEIMNMLDSLDYMMPVCAKGFHPPSVNLIQEARIKLYEIAVTLYAARTHTPPQ